MDRGAWRAVVHVVPKSRTQLSGWAQVREKFSGYSRPDSGQFWADIETRGYLNNILFNFIFFLERNAIVAQNVWIAAWKQVQWGKEKLCFPKKSLSIMYSVHGFQV